MGRDGNGNFIDYTMRGGQLHETHIFRREGGGGVVIRAVMRLGVEYCGDYSDHRPPPTARIARQQEEYTARSMRSSNEKENKQEGSEGSQSCRWTVVGSKRAHRSPLVN